MITTSTIELSVVMPCLNEAETLAVCIRKAQGYFERSGVVGEVVIADNGSTDGSQEIARDLGARVVDVPEKGYGSALMGGIEAALGQYVIMGDADDSYDFSNLDPFVERLRAGDDLVMGNRFRGGIEPGAMPPLHKYLGNPVLSFIGRLFFPSQIRDFHCGLRGFKRESILSIGLITTGMEFASEIVVKSTLAGPEDQRGADDARQGRPVSRPPHLRSWRDGWRHLRFLLIFSPRWLFLYPGAIAFLIGLIGSAMLAFGPVEVGSVGFNVVDAGLPARADDPSATRRCSSRCSPSSTPDMRGSSSHAAPPSSDSRNERRWSPARSWACRSSSSGSSSASSSSPRGRQSDSARRTWWTRCASRSRPRSS